MRQDVIISIKRKYSDKIYSGEKLFELRKRRPSFPVGTICWIYEPAPISLITGYFIYCGCAKENKVQFYFYNKFCIGVSAKEFFDYYEGEYYAHAWAIESPKKLANPISLKEISVKRAPQSYMFINGELIDKRLN